MKVARYLTAALSILLILIGGILKSLDYAFAPVIILGGFSVLLLGYIPVFILHISKKLDDEERKRSQ